MKIDFDNIEMESLSERLELVLKRGPAQEISPITYGYFFKMFAKLNPVKNNFSNKTMFFKYKDKYILGDQNDVNLDGYKMLEDGSVGELKILKDAIVNVNTVVMNEDNGLLNYEPLYLRLRVLDFIKSSGGPSDLEVYDHYSVKKGGRSNFKCIDEVLVTSESGKTNRDAFDGIFGEGGTEELLRYIESSTISAIKHRLGQD